MASMQIDLNLQVDTSQQDKETKEDLSVYGIWHINNNKFDGVKVSQVSCNSQSINSTLIYVIHHIIQHITNALCSPNYIDPQNQNFSFIRRLIQLQTNS